MTPLPPTARGERLACYEICPLFTYSACYREVYIPFWDGEFCGWGGFPWSFPGEVHYLGLTSGVNFTLERFDIILNEILFIFLLSL